jgi:hypothetical protein
MGARAVGIAIAGVAGERFALSLPDRDRQLAADTVPAFPVRARLRRPRRAQSHDSGRRRWSVWARAVGIEEVHARRIRSPVPRPRGAVADLAEPRRARRGRRGPPDARPLGCFSASDSQYC